MHLHARNFGFAASLLVATLACEARAPTPDPAVLEATTEPGGELLLRIDRAQLQRLGLRTAAPLDAEGHWSMDLLSEPGLVLALDDGAPTRVLQGMLQVPRLRFLRADGARSPSLRVAARPDGKALHLSFTDLQGREWLHLGQGMRSPDPADGFRIITAEVCIGEALADWLKQDVAGELFAGASLQVPLSRAAGAVAIKAGKSCAAPNWPGTPGYTADVILTNIDAVEVQPARCRNLDAPGNACDGPGGAAGEVVIVPSATLRNSSEADAAEVPWYTKFSGNFPPYGNDQHPYLVWNLYRIDADGSIAQVAQSGVKHAFATANTGCAEPCFNSHILGRGCADLYDRSSNDCASFLAPRVDVIPATGQWGRCGSIHDPDCDGLQGLPPYGNPPFCAAPNSSTAGDGYTYRLAVRESDLDLTLHPGARWFADAWYVVRDDINIFNNMGFREIFPTFGSGGWSTGAVLPFVAGPVIDRWLELAPDGVERRRVDAGSAEGNISLASRVSRLPDGRYRYDYALMNFDFTRPVTSGAEPNLRIIRNLGLSGIRIEMLNAASSDSTEFADGDLDGGNDWVVTTPAGAVQWSAAAGAEMGWSRMLRVSIVSAAPPGNGTARLDIAENGTPAFFELAATVPDQAQLFRDDFE